MIACFSLEVSRTESKRLEEANVLPNSTVTAIIAAVPWLQMLKQHLTLFDTPWTEDFHTRCFKVTLSHKGSLKTIFHFSIFFSWALTSLRSFSRSKMRKVYEDSLCRFSFLSNSFPGKFISSWKWHWKRGLGTREYNGKIARLLPS